MCSAGHRFRFAGRGTRSRIFTSGSTGFSAPPQIRVAPLPGDRLVHRDLHPMNVMMTAVGPIVMDWANASAGSPAFDVADTWCCSCAVRLQRKVSIDGL